MTVKPRLRKRFGVWCCRLPDYFQTRTIAHGYTPKEAYQDWQARCAAKYLPGGAQ